MKTQTFRRVCFQKSKRSQVRHLRQERHCLLGHQEQGSYLLSVLSCRSDISFLKDAGTFQKSPWKCWIASWDAEIIAQPLNDVDQKLMDLQAVFKFILPAATLATPGQAASAPGFSYPVLSYITKSQWEQQLIVSLCSSELWVKVSTIPRLSTYSSDEPMIKSPVASVPTVIVWY